MKKSIVLKGVDIQALIGAGDTNLRILEDKFSARFVVRGNEFHIDGEKGEVETIGNLIHEMSQTLNRLMSFRRSTRLLLEQKRKLRKMPKN